ncbi:STAS domain-containing protein [Bosea sp. NPDC055332]
MAAPEWSQSLPRRRRLSEIFTNRLDASQSPNTGPATVVITVSLPPFLGRSEAAAFRNQLLVALEQKESIAVECAEAGPFPSLWIQLMHAAATSAKARGLSVTLKAASEECRQSFQAIGFDPAQSALVLE